MDWFLSDRDLRHERVNNETGRIELQEKNNGSN